MPTWNIRLRILAEKNTFLYIGAQAAGNAAAAVASGQPETAIEHTDYRNKLSEIRTIYHQEVNDI